METNYTEEQKYLRAKKKVKSIKGFYVHFMVYLLVNAFILLSRALSDGGWEVFWEWQSYNTPIFWGIGLAFHAFGVFGMDIILGKNWEDNKIKELMNKDKRDTWE
ncbi:MAG: 2TM domain-containing protein [Lutibacter sp.]|uniref:2TM domain-containing protein n=1 Tax=Lutibacter sp. TaxID=1925666 RepID=UPI003859DDC6